MPDMPNNVDEFLDACGSDEGHICAFCSIDRGEPGHMPTVDAFVTVDPDPEDDDIVLRLTEDDGPDAMVFLDFEEASHLVEMIRAAAIRKGWIEDE